MPFTLYDLLGLALIGPAFVFTCILPMVTVMVLRHYKLAQASLALGLVMWFIAAVLLAIPTTHTPLALTSAAVSQPATEACNTPRCYNQDKR